MKIIYCFSDTIGSSTIMKKGFLKIESEYFSIENEAFVCNIRNILKLEKIKINGLGTIIKIKTDEKTIFLAVPRLFINIGMGFAIINYVATNRIYNSLMQSRKIIT